MAFGLQYAIQFADPYQSHLEEIERYFETNTISNTLSGQVAFRANQHIQMRVAYTEQIGEGRLIKPINKLKGGAVLQSLFIFLAFSNCPPSKSRHSEKYRY